MCSSALGIAWMKAATSGLYRAVPGACRHDETSWMVRNVDLIQRSRTDRLPMQSSRLGLISSGTRPYAMNIEQPIARTLSIHRGIRLEPARSAAPYRICRRRDVAFSLLGRAARLMPAVRPGWRSIARSMAWGVTSRWVGRRVPSHRGLPGISQPVQHLDAAVCVVVVHDYAARAQRIGELEGEIDGLSAASGSRITPAIADIQTWVPRASPRATSALPPCGRHDRGAGGRALGRAGGDLVMWLSRRALHL